MIEFAEAIKNLPKIGGKSSNGQPRFVILCQMNEFKGRQDSQGIEGFLFSSPPCVDDIVCFNCTFVAEVPMGVLEQPDFG